MSGMFRALGARVVLDWKGADGAEIVAEAARTAWRWATHGMMAAPGDWQECDLTEGATRVRCSHAADEGRELYETWLAKPDDWDPAITWRTVVDLVRSASRVECGIAVEQQLSDHRIAPSPLQPPLLGLLQELVEHGALAGSQRVSPQPQGVVGTDGVAHFIDHVLLDRDRRLPVLLFAAVKEQDGCFMPAGTDPSLVARELCGLAHVYLLPRAEDTHKLTKRLHLLSAYDGAIRIYWPRFQLTDPPPRHPLHLRNRLNPTSVPAIIRRIVEAGARAYRPPDGTQTLLAMRWRERELERITALVAEQADPAKQVGVLDRELLRIIDENVGLAQEVEALRDELERAHRRLDDAGTLPSDGEPGPAAFSGGGVPTQPG